MGKTYIEGRVSQMRLLLGPRAMEGVCWIGVGMEPPGGFRLTCDISPVKYTSACLPTSMDPPEPAQMAIVRTGDERRWGGAG